MDKYYRQLGQLKNEPGEEEKRLVDGLYLLKDGRRCGGLRRLIKRQ